MPLFLGTEVAGSEPGASTRTRPALTWTRAIAADVEDAIGLTCGFVAGPGGPRVDADAREGVLLVNVLGHHVSEARAHSNGRGGDSVDGVGQALFVWRREHEGGSDARVEQASPSGVPVTIKQSGVGEHDRNRVGGRGPGEFVDNGRVGVGHVQRRKARTGHEVRVGDADGGSREVVVAVVVVVDESPAECVVSCARDVVGAVGAFRARRRSRVSRTDSTRSARVMGAADVRVFVSSAAMRGGAQSWAARTRSCSSVRLPGVGGVRSGVVGVCCEESASGASEGFGAGCFSRGRGRGGCRHCLSFHSTTLRLLSKCEALWRSNTPTMAAISRTASAPQAFRGDASSRNEKSGNLTSCLLVGGCFFGHWRSGTTFSLATGGTTRRAVRKRRAPQGALRPLPIPKVYHILNLCQKASSATRCIKTCHRHERHINELILSRKAPSAIRCIKTSSGGALHVAFGARQKAPGIRKFRMQFP